MQKIFFLIIALLFCASFSFADAIIGPELQKALDNTRSGEKINVMVTLNKQFSASNLIATHTLRGGVEDVKAQVFDILKAECETDQHFINSLCQRMLAAGQVSDVHNFWLANALSLEGTADAIRELAMQPDVHSINLDAEQQMIDPIAATEEARSLWGLDHIKSKVANQNGITGEGVIVAVTDTGIDTDHSAFKPGQILVDKCTSFVSGESTVEDGHGHGTHCAGTIGSFKYGVAPGVKIIGVKVLSRFGSGTWEGVMQGVEYAAKHAHVISMSLGGRASVNGNVVETAVKNATEGGVTVVIAAGNSGPSPRTIGTPGVVEEALTVGAINSSSSLASFSSRGPTVYGTEKPDFVAPGVDVLSAWKDGGTNTISGTSMATPHVAGLVALYLGKFKGAKADQIKQRIKETAFGTKKVNEYGSGCVDCVNATQSADIMILEGEREGSKTIQFNTDGNGNVNQAFTIWVPFEVTITAFQVSCNFANATVILNNKTVLNTPINGGAKTPINVKTVEGNNNVGIKATNGSVKGGTVTATVYFSIWE
jgi:subtilisin family serine protease